MDQKINVYLYSRDVRYISLVCESLSSVLFPETPLSQVIYYDKDKNEYNKQPVVIFNSEAIHFNNESFLNMFSRYPEAPYYNESKIHILTGVKPFKEYFKNSIELSYGFTLNIEVEENMVEFHNLDLKKGEFIPFLFKETFSILSHLERRATLDLTLDIHQIDWMFKDISEHLQENKELEKAKISLWERMKLRPSLVHWKIYEIESLENSKDIS